MPLLVPDWNQPRPTIKDVLEMCRNIGLTALEVPAEPFEKFVSKIRSERRNGGAYLNVFDVGPSPVFDWFASRNRLWDDRLLDWLVLHPTIAQSFPELRIPVSPREDSLNTGFAMFDPFLLDGTFASLLYHGGAYSHAKGDGVTEKELAMDVCKSMFGLRHGEIVCNMNYGVWTPWFKGIAWDVTAIVFDRASRKLWMFATTDTD
jgi:hypothetical protein